MGGVVGKPGTAVRCGGEADGLDRLDAGGQEVDAPVVQPANLIAQVDAEPHAAIRAGGDGRWHLRGFSHGILDEMQRMARRGTG